MRSRIRRTGTLATVLALLVALSQAVGVSAAGPDIAAVKAATARFHHISAAKAAGYGLLPAPAPLHSCILSLTGTGGMGYHFINAKLLDGNLDAAHPEAVIYGRVRHGHLRIVALEYVVFEADWIKAHGSTAKPTLLGKPLTLVKAPNRYEIPAFYELHAWVWQANPEGMFTDFNPNVSCD